MVAVLALAAGLALPATAGAATAVSYDRSAGLRIGSFDDVRDSRIQSQVIGSEGNQSYQVFSLDPAGSATADTILAGTGCTRPETSVVCPITGVRFITVDLRGGNDSYVLGAASDSNISGGAGNDEIDGSIGFDAIDGGDGDDLLSGGPGDDVIRGGNGSDTFDGSSRTTDSGTDTLLGEGGDDVLHPASGATPDHFDGGRGTDTADYSIRSAPVFLSTAFSLFANDGATGEGDDLDNVERLIGGSGADTLTALGSTRGILIGGLGADTLRGGPNNDEILSRDGIEDNVNCGDGLDIGEVDLRDVGFAATCESGGEEDRREGPGVRIQTKSTRTARDGELTVRLVCPRAARQTCAGTLRARGRATGPRSRYRIRRGRGASVPVSLSSRDSGKRVQIRLISLERGRHGLKTRWRTITVRP